MNLALFLVPLLAQQFEVASIKSYRGSSIGNQNRDLVSPNGDLRIVNMSLRTHGLNDSQLSGGPQRFDVDRWSIEAKVCDAPPRYIEKTTSVRLMALL